MENLTGFSRREELNRDGMFTSRALRGRTGAFVAGLLCCLQTANCCWAAPGGPGTCDYNSNGICDAADYTVWRDTLGTTTLSADGNQNGDIDLGDYNFWRIGFGQQFGRGSGVGSFSGVPANAGVPEPSSIALTALAAAALFLGRRHRIDPLHAEKITAVRSATVQSPL